MAVDNTYKGECKMKNTNYNPQHTVASAKNWALIY